MAKNRVRKWLRILHRDLGYLVAGLTIVYAISGIAVNHVQDWNPNISVERSVENIGNAAGFAGSFGFAAGAGLAAAPVGRLTPLAGAG